MEWITVKMPVEDYETIQDAFPPTDGSVTRDWIVEERYEDSEEITATDIATKIIRQGLKDLNKALFDLKHQKP